MTPLWILSQFLLHFQSSNQKPSLNIFLHFHTADEPQDGDHGGDDDTGLANIRSHGMDLLKVKNFTKYWNF